MIAVICARIMPYIIMSAPESEGIAATISVLTNIEKVLHTAGYTPNAIRSHLSGYTGDQSIDKFLGLTEYLDVLPPANPWTITGHTVITFSELILLFGSSQKLPALDMVEIAFTFSDWGNPHFHPYMAGLDSNVFSDYDSMVQKAILSSPARNQALQLSAMINQQGKKCVFCNVRRGEISFIAQPRIANYLDAKGQPGFYYPFTGEYFDNANIKDAPQGFRFISIDSYVDALYSLIREYSRTSLFIVVSTDGYWKVLEHFGRKSELIKPIDNDLIGLLNSEFAELMQLSDLFLPGGSAFHTRSSIVYSALAEMLVNGPSNFPLVIKGMFGFPCYSHVIDLKSAQ
jgi:hypothetical protein